MKHLYRDQESGIWMGVFLGLGEYFDEDPTIFRILFCILGLATGFIPALVIYAILTLCIPDKDTL